MKCLVVDRSFGLQSGAFSPSTFALLLEMWEGKKESRGTNDKNQRERRRRFVGGCPFFSGG